jgi:WD40 repeat protein
MTTTKRAYKLRILHSTALHFVFFFVLLYLFFALNYYLASSLDALCLEEFVAHASAVNCLKIGRKSSRVLVTGGEDHKVNLWAIGKPNAILVRSFSSIFLIPYYYF